MEQLIHFLSVYEKEARRLGSAHADLLATILQLLQEGHLEALLPQLRYLASEPTTPPEVTALFFAIINAIEQEHPELREV